MSHQLKNFEKNGQHFTKFRAKVECLLFFFYSCGKM